MVCIDEGGGDVRSGRAGAVQAEPYSQKGSKGRTTVPARDR